MKSTGINLFAVAFATSLLVASCERRQAREVELPNKVEVKKDTTLITLQPDNELYEALKDFSNNNKEQCSRHITTAIYYIRPLASKAASDPDRKMAIDNAIKSLHDLADKISSEEVQDITLVHTVFGQTGRALAGYRLWIIEREYVSRAVSKSGEQLERTIQQLEKSIKTHDRALTDSEKKMLGHGLDLAKQLKANQRIAEGELQKAVADINQVIERWSNELEKKSY